MELRHLEYFLMLSKELHFTKAAEKLGISQPTLSHQIKLLEKELGYNLFNRVGKKVELTTVGEIVQQEAINVQKSIESIHTRILSVSNLEVGELKIAVLPGEMTDLVSTICIHFKKLYPNIKIFIETTDQIEEAILQNRADFGIGFKLQPKDSLQYTKLYQERFYMIHSDKKTREPIDFQQIHDESLILFPNTQQCRKLLNKTCSNLGITLEPVVETSSIASLLNLVRNDVGISIVSKTLFEFYDTADLHYQPIEQDSLTQNVYIVVKKNCFINYAARAYLKLVIREIKKLQFEIDDDALSIFE